MSFSSETAVIGGSGLYRLLEGSSAEKSYKAKVATPYDDDPVLLFGETVYGSKVWFLPRHGERHAIPPHAINYRANIHALKDRGVRQIVAVNVVGGISPEMVPGVIVLPDQIIDYTWGRAHTYFDNLGSFEDHIDFSWPYDASLRKTLADHAVTLGIRVLNKAIYACTQGPRLETAAEIQKIKFDGCDIVGMTGMPEAALARELGIAYACISLVVNRAAGLEDKEVVDLSDMKAILQSGLNDIRRIIFDSLQDIAARP